MIVDTTKEPIKKEIDWQTFKCRCSSINQMLSNSQSNAPLTEVQAKELATLEEKEERTPKQAERITELVLKREKAKTAPLSDTCIGYLMQHYAWVTQKMVSISKEMDIESLQKGKSVEPDSIILLSVVDQVIYEKNPQRISNDFLSGEPDVFLGEEIMKAEVIIDVKSIWDYPGYLKKVNSQLDPSNEKQIQGYCDISGAFEGYVANCLVNMPETIVNDYRRKLMYKMNCVTDQDPKYLEAVAVLENSMHFERIPRQQRVYKQKVERFTQFERLKVYDKVKICRDWLNNFHEMYIKLNN